MMEISDEVRAAWQSEGEARETLYRQAVDALTAAAKLTRTTAGGSVEQGDFAEFLVQAVAAVAANLGSIDDGQVIGVDQLDPCTAKDQATCQRIDSPGLVDAVLEVPADSNIATGDRVTISPHVE